jgi:transglutaminase-like putative cysteine protease
MVVLPWLMTSAVATVAPHAESLPNWLGVGVLALLLCRIWLWQRQVNALAPIWLFLLATAGTASVLVEFRTVFGREPGVALLTLLMMLKLMELRTPRDGTVVVMLAYFLLLTHYFIADSMSVGMWMLVAMILTTASLMRLQSPAAMSPAATVKYSAGLVVQALPVTLVLFVLFPRISGPLWGLPQDLRRATSGLSDEMSPGSISELSQSAALAFRVEFADSPPAREQLYWRGPVMSDYDGRTWRSARNFTAPSGVGAPHITPLGEEITYTITLEPHMQRWLLALDLPTRLPPESRLDPSLSVTTRMPVRERRRLIFSSTPHYRAGEQESPAMRQRALALPTQGNAQTRKLAEEWKTAAERSGRPVEQTVAARALTMFREQAFVYTLRPPPLGENAIDEFIFTARKGFCEHYAAAFTFIMRAAGIPARVVGGYLGGEFNPLDGVLTVRQSDAHAWAEVWIAGQGWVRYDPTAAVAPSRVDQGLQAALPEGEPVPPLLRGDLDWLRALRYRWDLVNNAWNVWVIGYNADRQQELLRRFGLSGSWTTLLALLAVCGISATALILSWILRQPRENEPALRYWNQACRRLGTLGFQRRPDEGPICFSERVAAGNATLALVTRRVAALYIRARYAGEASPSVLAALKKAVKDLSRRPTSWSKWS